MRQIYCAVHVCEMNWKLQSDTDEHDMRLMTDNKGWEQ